MNKQRIAILIAAGLGVLSTFMPWVTMPFIGSINGMHEVGWTILILFIIPLIISLTGDKKVALKGGLLYAAIIPSIIAGIIGIWKMVELKTEFSNEMGDNPFTDLFEASVSIGLGLYLVVIAGIALPILAFAIKDNQ